MTKPEERIEGKRRGSARRVGVLLAFSLAVLLVGCEDLIYETPEFNNPYDPINEESDRFDYTIGDVGPAGGLVFYIDEADAHPWTYLEVAPETWYDGTSDPVISWQDQPVGDLVEIGPDAQGTAIGTGHSNTTAIVTWLDDENLTDQAAQVVDAASFGGVSDWFLPSRDELNAIWENIVDDGEGNNNGVGGFAPHFYWSSSEENEQNTWYQDFSDGFQDFDQKVDDWRVRAVRSF